MVCREIDSAAVCQNAPSLCVCSLGMVCFPQTIIGKANPVTVLERLYRGACLNQLRKSSSVSKSSNASPKSSTQSIGS